MSNDTPSSMPSTTTEPARGRVLRSAWTASVAAVVLGAFITAPVGSSDVPFTAVVEMNSATREPDEGMRRTAVMTTSLSAPGGFPAARAVTADSVSYSVDAERKRIPLFFGFIEFDWDPNAPGGVPGFGPMP